jgi:hypothetical protein
VTQKTRARPSWATFTNVRGVVLVDERVDPYAGQVDHAGNDGAVLVVDDEPMVREVVARYLEHDGHRVHEVGVRALHSSRSEPQPYERWCRRTTLPQQRRNGRSSVERVDVVRARERDAPRGDRVGNDDADRRSVHARAWRIPVGGVRNADGG